MDDNKLPPMLVRVWRRQGGQVMMTVGNQHFMVGPEDDTSPESERVEHAIWYGKQLVGALEKAGCRVQVDL